MKKGGVFLVVTFLLLVFFSCYFTYAYEYNTSDVSITEDYAAGEALSGIFFLNLSNAPADIWFSSDFGNLPLRSVLKDTDLEFSCEIYNCTDLYSIVGSGSETKQVYSSNAWQSFGSYIIGDQLAVGGFGLTINSQFAESNSMPFSIKVAEDYVWNFDYPSSNWNNLRNISYGCFDSSAAYTNKTIDVFGYCEQYNLSASRSYYLKANISGSSSVTDFRMSLFKNNEELGFCDFSNYYANYSSDIGCVVDLSQQTESGVYDVCIKYLGTSEISNYTIKRETAGATCGYYKNSTARTSDYSIYVLTPKYSSLSGVVQLSEDFGDNSAASIENYLSAKYPDGCVGGCVIPISFYGNGVQLNLSDISLRYITNEGPEENKKINDVSKTKTKINFSNFISLDSFGWYFDFFGSKNISIYLDDGTNKSKLFTIPVNIQSAPLIRAIYPMIPPAGVNVFFYADVLYNFSKLEWNFGDGTPMVSTNGYATTHIYSNVSQIYNLTIKAYGTNYSTQKSFMLETISPESYINASLDLKRTRLTRLNEQIDALPALYREKVKELLNITELFDFLGQIGVARTLAYSPDQFLEIANELVGISVPTNVVIGDRFSSSAIGMPNSTDPSIMMQISYGNYTNLDKYKSAIVGWQFNNIIAQIVSEQVKAYSETGQVNNLVRVYHISLTSKANETSYFVIQKLKSELYFETDVAAKEVEGKSAIYFELLPGASLTLDFFVTGSEDVPMFVSPKLSSLSTNNIAPCNFNLVCQKDLGEDYKNCRSDCKPFWPTVFLIFILIIFILTLYTLLQIWYKVRYEKRLFSDRVFLFNLIAFINNSKVNGMVYGEIYSALSSKGWSSEQISYAIKKAEGRNTGMYELIPVEKILAYFAMKKAEKNKSQRVAIPVNNIMRMNMGAGVSPRPLSRSNTAGFGFRNKDNFRKI